MEAGKSMPCSSDSGTDPAAGTARGMAVHGEGTMGSQ